MSIQIWFDITFGSEKKSQCTTVHRVTSVQFWSIGIPFGAFNQSEKCFYNHNCKKCIKKK